MKRWRLPLAFVLVCGTLLWVFLHSFGKDPHAVPFMLRGKPAPGFNLKRLDSGERTTLASLKGKPLVINFWASWCGPCKQEHPVLEWGAREFGQDVQFLGVIFEDTDDNARRLIAANGGAAYPQFIDPLSSMAVDYGTSGVPETYFIDAAGMIRDKFVGPIDPQTLHKQVEALLAPLPAAGVAEGRP